MKKLAIGMFVMFAGIKPADAAALEQLEAMGGAPASASMVFDGNAAREGTKEAVDPAPVQGLSGKSGAKAPEIEIERASPLKTGAANGINSTPEPMPQLPSLSAPCRRGLRLEVSACRWRPPSFWFRWR